MYRPMNRAQALQQVTRSKDLLLDRVQTARNNGATFDTPAALNSKLEAALSRAVPPEV